LPLGDWAEKLRQRGIPAQVSYHAGTYLCNAMLYWTHYFAERDGLRTRAAFIHVPLDPSQVVDAGRNLASMSTSSTAAALGRIISEIHAAANQLA
jgi:pyroglutamyl-peptidase